MRKLSSLALLALGISTSAVAQTPAHRHPTSDAAKMADALRAAPPFITKGATIMDWPATPTGEYRVLRAGTTAWTCLPASPLYPHDEPGCFDAVFFKWIKDSMAGEKAPPVDKVGISYMYNGAWVPDLKGNAPQSPDHTFHVGPHIMIITPNDVALSAFSRDDRMAGSMLPIFQSIPACTSSFLSGNGTSNSARCNVEDLHTSLYPIWPSATT
jgi:hypothetical protein